MVRVIRALLRRRKRTSESHQVGIRRPGKQIRLSLSALQGAEAARRRGNSLHRIGFRRTSGWDTHLSAIRRPEAGRRPPCGAADGYAARAAPRNIRLRGAAASRGGGDARPTVLRRGRLRGARGYARCAVTRAAAAGDLRSCGAGGDAERAVGRGGATRGGRRCGERGWRGGATRGGRRCGARGDAARAVMRRARSRGADREKGSRRRRLTRRRAGAGGTARRARRAGRAEAVTAPDGAPTCRTRPRGCRRASRPCPCSTPRGRPRHAAR